VARHCHLYRGKNDTIAWNNCTASDCTIKFTNTNPFDSDEELVVPANGGVLGPLSLKPKIKTGPYPYDLVPTAKVTAVDPNVIIH
jgi:hypothetical protein